jgi:hypothetical protein
MNMAQRLVLLLGLIIIVSIFYAPYTATKYRIEREWFYGGKNHIDKVLLYEWVEFNFVFAPPLSEAILSFDSAIGYQKYLTYKQRDYIMQLSIISGDILAIAILFFVFKTKQKNKTVNKQLDA